MIIFLYGEDTFRSKEKLEEIIEGYKKIHKSGLNLFYFNAKENSFSDFFDSFKIVPMFSEKKLVILKNLFTCAKFSEDFLLNISRIKDLKDIIIVYEECVVDQRTKLFKSLEKNSKCQECNFFNPVNLRKWMLSECEKNNLKINPGAADLLLSFVGKDLWRMKNEINKLLNYKAGKIIERSDVELLVRKNIENDIFKTIDALAARDKTTATNLLSKHLENGENCFYLLSMFIFQFRNLLVIKELIESGTPYGLIAKKAGLHPFVVKKGYYLCNNFSFLQLKKIYLRIFQIDSEIKSGKIDAELALYMLISEI